MYIAKFLSLAAIFCLFVGSSSAQETYVIKADSVKITNCDSAELILENHTQGVKGFLYNTGNGRTIFKKGVVKLSNGLYQIGADTLNLGSTAWLQGGNTYGATGVLGTQDNYPVDLYTNNTQQARLTTAGNLLVGTTTDSSYRLQVKGSSGGINITQALRGSSAMSGLNIYADWRTSGAPTAFKVSVDDSVNNYSSNLVDVQENGVSRLKIPVNSASMTFIDNGFKLITSHGTSGGITFNGSPVYANKIVASSDFELTTNTGKTSAGDGMVFSGSTYTQTTGNINCIRSYSLFQPTSGTGTFNMLALSSTINQTGGANGISRGLYVVPTITAAADFRAIEVAAGKSVFNDAVNITGTNGYSQLRLVTHYTPTSSADTNGSAGDTAVDDNYFYYKTSTGWKRAALTTF